MTTEQKLSALIEVLEREIVKAQDPEQLSRAQKLANAVGVEFECVEILVDYWTQGVEFCIDKIKSVLGEEEE